MGVSLALLMAPLLAQGALTLLDELVFHRKRGLPPWEIWGHPLDTLTVAACYLFLLLVEPGPWSLGVYGALAAASSLFVTKDEFVHHERCCAREQWLHSLLFLLHPVAFAAAAGLWWWQARELLLGQLLLLGIFFFYQVIYWGFPRGRRAP